MPVRCGVLSLFANFTMDATHRDKAPIVIVLCHSTSPNPPYFFLFWVHILCRCPFGVHSLVCSCQANPANWYCALEILVDGRESIPGRPQACRAGRKHTAVALPPIPSRHIHGAFDCGNGGSLTVKEGGNCAAWDTGYTEHGNRSEIAE